MIARLHCHGIPQLAALVALCAGGSTRAVAQASPDARVYDCAALITEREIDRVIGQSGTKLRFGSRDAQDPTGPGVTVFTGEAREYLDQAWTRSQGGGAQALSGIGERALLADAPGGRILLARVRGGAASE